MSSPLAGEATTSSSPDHTKPLKLAGVRFSGDLYIGHMRARRALVAPGDEGAHRVLFPFYHRLNVPVYAVPHPTR
jgi:hypothetical protein